MTNDFITDTHILQDMNQQKSPISNRRRASSITLARTIPNFGSPQPPTSPMNEIYRYMKCDDPKQKRTQQVKEQHTAHTTRYESFLIHIIETFSRVCMYAKLFCINKKLFWRRARPKVT